MIFCTYSFIHKFSRVDILKLAFLLFFTTSIFAYNTSITESLFKEIKVDQFGDTTTIKSYPYISVVSNCHNGDKMLFTEEGFQYVTNYVKTIDSISIKNIDSKEIFKISISKNSGPNLVTVSLVKNIAKTIKAKKNKGTENKNDIDYIYTSFPNSEYNKTERLFIKNGTMLYNDLLSFFKRASNSELKVIKYQISGSGNTTNELCSFNFNNFNNMFGYAFEGKHNRRKELSNVLQSFGYREYDLYDMDEFQMEIILENVKSYCKNSKIYGEYELFNSHPTMTKGKFYHFTGNFVQYLDTNIALYSDVDDVILIVADNASSITKTFNGYVQSMGSFQYETALGTINTVPQAVPISFTNKRELLGYKQYKGLYKNLENLYPKLFSDYCIPYIDEVKGDWYNFFLKNNKLPQFFVKTDFNEDGKSDIILLMKSIDSDSGKLIFILSTKSELNNFTYKKFEYLELNNLYNFGIELASQGVHLIRYEEYSYLLTWDKENNKVVQSNLFD